jgi:hypothetical protein
MDWKWMGDAVNIGAETFAIKKNVSRDELNAFSDVVMRKADVYGLLSTALAAFKSGNALYDGCKENAVNLLAGFREAEADAIAAASDIGLFFDPAIKPDRLPRSASVWLKFSMEAARKLNALALAAVKPVEEAKP